MTPRHADPFAAAMGLTDVPQERPWYLAATPLATLPWLIRLRRATAAIELALLAITFGVPSLDLPLDHIAAFLLLDAIANLLVSRHLAQGRPLARPWTLVVLAIQVLLLTGLLEITGGPSNPFAVVYVLQITWAALTLGAAPASLVAAFAAACFGVLIYWHAYELAAVHHRLNDFPTHLFTMWIAGAAAAELIAYFAVRVSDALLRRERELDTMRQRAAKTEKLVSLTTLAAGAAHELSTPLATIAITSKELEHALRGAAVPAECCDDARLIRREVDRCQLILDQMSGRAGGVAAEAPEAVRADSVLADVAARLPDHLAARLRTEAPDALPTLVVPRAGLVQSLLSLVKNALDATEVSGAVIVRIESDGHVFRFTVQDDGPGMSSETLRRAGEPFYTTKEPGRGLGLGLFLARVFAERSGGSLSLRSDGGTTAVLEVPVSPAGVEVA